MVNPGSNGAERHLLDPELPYAMGPRVAKAVQDPQLQQFVHSATELKDQGRRDTCAAAFGANYDRLRKHAGAIKQHTLDHLDHYLARWIDNAEARGVTVHFAATSEEANAIAVEIAREHDCTLCVKSKSMVTEETHLLPALEAVGVETLETDLGEFIIQIDRDAPSHIVTPMIHKDRVATRDAFRRTLGVEATDDPEELTEIARVHMRDKYCAADLGITGANFLIAETGGLVLCTNEGNADLVVTGPRVHVAMVGIEKVIPERRHLPVFLKLLARSATAQPLTVYTTTVTGPARADDADGPDQVHVILVDNGRTELLREEARELLRCIRCGACLNACPIFRHVGGGHAYGSVYSGPIGAVLTPELKGLTNYPDLPKASSLCGACFEACPVHIDIPRHLVRLRGAMVDAGALTFSQRMGMRIWGFLLRGRWRYRAFSGLQRFGLRWLGRGVHSERPPMVERRWLGSGPGPVRGWTEARDMPTPTAHDFRKWWRRRSRI